MGRKGRKGRKDPLRPKRPVTAFMCFSMVRRRELTVKKPHWEFARLSRLVGKEWRGLSEAERAPYEKTSQKDKVRYLREMSTYVPPPESSSEESDEESDEDDSADDSDGSESSCGSGDSASDDGYSASSGSEDDGDAARSDRNAIAGPPYPRQEYCAPVARIPILSSALMPLLPQPSKIALFVPPANQVMLKKTEFFWRKVEESAAAAAETHWEAMSITQTANSPLPAFGKHMVLSQTRRQVACFVSIVGSDHAEYSATAGFSAHPLAVKKNRIMTPDAVSNLYASTRPVYVGQSDFLVIPSLDELLAVPKRMLDNCDPLLQASLSKQAANERNQMSVRRCIYARRKVENYTDSGRAGIARGGVNDKRTQFEFCVLSREFPWMAFMAEVLVCIFEIEFTPRIDDADEKKRKLSSEGEGSDEESVSNLIIGGRESDDGSVEISSSTDVDSNRVLGKPRKKRRRRR